MSFLYFDPSYAGYLIYREHLHQHVITGILHGIFMPIATIGFFIAIYAALSMAIIGKGSSLCHLHDNVYDIANNILLCILSGFWTGYFSYTPIMGTFTIFFYYIIIRITIDKTHSVLKNWRNDPTSFWVTWKYQKYLLTLGLLLIAGSLFFMEIIGHWILEGEGSDLTKVINSIYHTPPYAMESLFFINKIF